MIKRLEPGTVIEGFRLGAPLHAGGNGYVYEAVPVHGDDGRPIVIKVPGIGPADPALGLVSFEVEQMIHPTLTGTHVPRFVAAGIADGLPYLVMERVQGEGLPGIVARAPLPLDEFVHVAAALADAVHSVHRQEVVHLDIKPENFILRPNGEAVLLDYGYARHARFPDLLGEERQNEAGSAAYVSPEQLRGVRGDPRSDVFSLGVLLYQLATGELPFGEPTTYAGWRDRLWRVPPPPRLYRADLPPWVQEVLLAAIEVDPERRYPSAAHVAFDLRNPSQVRLTERSQRTSGSGFAAQARNWWRAKRHAPEARPPAISLAPAPVILVAVDTEHPDDERHPALQAATKAIVSLSSDFRLMFVSVIRAAPLGGERLEETASGKQLEHRNRLRHWTEPLKLPAARQSLHVVESPDPAETLLDLARANHVDLIVLGAPGASRALAWWRSVASTVTASAPCSVHVVRVPERDLPVLPVREASDAEDG